MCLHQWGSLYQFLGRKFSPWLCRSWPSPWSHTLKHTIFRRICHAPHLYPRWCLQQTGPLQKCNTHFTYQCPHQCWTILLNNETCQGIYGRLAVSHPSKGIHTLWYSGYTGLLQPASDLQGCLWLTLTMDSGWKYPRQLDCLLWCESWASTETKFRGVPL